MISPPSLCPLWCKFRQYPVDRQPLGHTCLTHHGPKTAPFPLFGRLYHTGPYWVEDDIPCQLQQISVCIDQYRLVSALKQMTAAPVASIRCLGIDAVELPHAPGQISIRCFYQEMIMVRHLAIGVTDPVPVFNHPTQQVQKHDSIFVILVNRLPPVAPRSDVIQRTGKFDSNGSCHED